MRPWTWPNEPRRAYARTASREQCFPKHWIFGREDFGVDRLISRLQLEGSRMRIGASGGARVSLSRPVARSPLDRPRLRADGGRVRVSDLVGRRLGFHIGTLRAAFAWNAYASRGTRLLALPTPLRVRMRRGRPAAPDRQHPPRRFRRFGLACLRGWPRWNQRHPRFPTTSEQARCPPVDAAPPSSVSFEPCLGDASWAAADPRTPRGGCSRVGAGVSPGKAVALAAAIVDTDNLLSRCSWSAGVADRLVALESDLVAGRHEELSRNSRRRGLHDAAAWILPLGLKSDGVCGAISASQ